MQTLIRLQALVALAVCIWVIVFFGVRLHTIAQMRKTISGIQIESHKVTRKWDTPGSGRRSPAYWISWAPAGRPTSDNSVSLDRQRWQQMRVGDTVTIARGSIEGIAYEIHGDFASDASLILYSLVVCGALAWAIWMCYVIVTVKPRRARGSWEQV